MWTKTRKGNRPCLLFRFTLAFSVAVAIAPSFYTQLTTKAQEHCAAGDPSALMSMSTMSRQPTGDSTPARDLLLPHPAEDLSADDDLLSWVLVDQLGCMPNTKLGVHPQQVKFVGPPFKTDEVLNIVREVSV